MANEKRMIDANALMDAFRGYMVERHDKEKCVSEENCKTCEKSCLWRKIVSVAPTVDAVEVCRCKDCKHYYYSAYAMRCVCDFDNKEWDKDDFCSYGERRSE